MKYKKGTTASEKQITKKYFAGKVSQKTYIKRLKQIASKRHEKEEKKFSYANPFKNKTRKTKSKRR